METEAVVNDIIRDTVKVDGIDIEEVKRWVNSPLKKALDACLNEYGILIATQFDIESTYALIHLFMPTALKIPHQDKESE